MADIATLTGGEGRLASAVPAHEVMALLATHGAVHFRGFACDPAEFVRLTRQYGDRFTTDPAKLVSSSRQGAGGLVGRVARAAARVTDRLPRPGTPDDGTRLAPFDAGYGINPHTENTFIPGACPDLVWFWCQRPAADGGDTLLCDGVELLGRLTPRAASFITTTQLRYTLTLESNQWRSVYGVATVDDLRRTLDAIPGLRYTLGAGDRMEYEYDVDQIGLTRLGGTATARTNVLSRRPYERVGDPEPERTATGEPVDAVAIGDLLEAVTTSRLQLPLATNDVVMIDNSRVMHGRTPFTDLTRRVHTRVGWLHQGAVEAAGSRS
jgi:alpha-ketoglutarate-dependent taurine dioxygenase